MLRLITSISLAAMLALLVGACSDDDTTFSAPDCSGGVVSSTFSSDTPSWISDNFTCVEVSVSGDNYIFKTRDTPPFTSVYYGEGHALYDAAAAGAVTNPNIISSQKYTITVPASPAIASSTTESGLGEIGVAVDGTIIFNNQANPPDTLAVEASSLDTNTGHPTGGGIYHYHVEMASIVSTGSELIGIALDGFPIYGRLEQDSNSPGPTFVGSAGVEATANWHSHTTTEFSTATPHYHIATGYTETNDSGTAVTLLYMVGTNMGGTVGRHFPDGAAGNLHACSRGLHTTKPEDETKKSSCLTRF